MHLRLYDPTPMKENNKGFHVGIRVKNYFELFCRKDLGLLDYFDALGLNVCKLSFRRFMLLECYILEKISFENFILLEDGGLMTFC